SVDDFEQSVFGHMSVEAGRRPAAILEDGMNRKLPRHAARIAYGLTHARHRFEVHAVAGRQVTAGLRDADDGFAAGELLAREAVIHEALEIQRDHVGMGGIVEPVARAEVSVTSHAIRPRNRWS